MALRVAALLALIAAPLPAADFTTLAGKKYSGTIVSVGDGNIVLKTEQGPLTLGVKEMASVDFGGKVEPPAGKYDELELIDGSVLRIAGLRIAEKKVEPAGLPGGSPPTFAVPIDCVFHWQRGADDAKAREEWKKLLAGRGKRDLFVIRESSGLSPLPGTILGGNAAGDAIDFEKENGEKVSFKLTRATGGLVFNQPPRGVIPSTLCKLHDAGGNTLIVHSLAITDGGATVKTVSGATVTYASLASVVKLDFSTGNVAYLSDMEPAVNAPPAVPGEPNWTYLKDKTPDGPGFKLNSAAFARGLWIAPDVSLTFKLNAEYREFKATVGIDDAIPVATSAARLTIEADGKAVFSELIGRKDKPRELTLDVKNVKQLKISVEGEGLFLGNQLDLADARLQK